MLYKLSKGAMTLTEKGLVLVGGYNDDLKKPSNLIFLLDRNSMQWTEPIMSLKVGKQYPLVFTIPQQLTKCGMYII